MTNIENLRYSFNALDFSEPHSTQLYPLGYTISAESEDGLYENVYIYIQSDGSGANAYQPYMYWEDFTLEVVAPGNVTWGDPFSTLLVPQFELGPNQFGFAQYRGKGKANVTADATGMAIGDYIEITTASDVNFQDLGPTLTGAGYGTVLESLDDLETKVTDVLLMGKGAYSYKP